VSIGIPKALAYTEANRGLILRFIGLGLISLLALAMVWMGSNVFIFRRVQALLRSLSSQLTSTEERERQRIAVDLHDSLGQTLAASNIKLGLLKEAAASSEYAESIQEIRKLITDAIRDTKSLVFKMSLGIEAALNWLVEQTRKEYGLDVECVVDNRDKPLDNDVRSFLFRAVNELLMNVVKHSSARHAMITVTADDERIRICVKDDGIGFDVSKTESEGGGANGFGLFSIRDRLSYVKGFMEMESQPGKGTKITLIAPLSSGADSRRSAI
jgi:signal transduction histidine kinase